MEQIKQYLYKDKRTFQEGAKLLFEKVEITAEYKKYFEAQLKKEEPDTIAVQLLDSQLRNFVRIGEQKKTVILQNLNKQDKPNPEQKKEQVKQMEHEQDKEQTQKENKKK